MNRCAICDTTDEDNPKAGITFYDTDRPLIPDRSTWYDGDTIRIPTAEELDLIINPPRVLGQEARCLECHNNIQENLEDLSIADEEFEFQDNGFTTTLP